jgi:hypothetical protein
MVWLAVNDDCKTAEEVKRRVMDIGKRPWKKPVPNVVAIPPPAPEPAPAPVYTLPIIISDFKPGKLHEILVQTSKHFNVSVPAILSDLRFRAVSRPRQVAYYLSKKLTTCSMYEIAKHYGKDHTSILKGIRTIEAILHFQNDKNIVYAVSKIAENLKGGRFGFRPLPDETKTGLHEKRDNRNKYDPEEIDRIKHLFMGGATEREISMIIGRSRQAVISKLSRMKKAGVFAL